MLIILRAFGCVTAWHTACEVLLLRVLFPEVQLWGQGLTWNTIKIGSLYHKNLKAVKRRNAIGLLIRTCYSMLYGDAVPRGYKEFQQVHIIFIYIFDVSEYGLPF